MKHKGRLCDSCQKPEARRLSLRAHAGARSASGSIRATSVTVGSIDLCATCYGRLVEPHRGFARLADIERWQDTQKGALRQRDQRDQCDQCGKRVDATSPVSYGWVDGALLCRACLDREREQVPA